jgi:hypothetical protein
VNTPDVCSSGQATVQQEDLQWFFDTFVPNPGAGFDLMNPVWATNKYIHKAAHVTLKLIDNTFRGELRRLSQEGTWHSFPYVIAVSPEGPDGCSRMAIIDIDFGGREAVMKVLQVCRSYGLWAFAQLSTSAQHDGGHVYIPADQPQPSSMLRNIADRVQALAGVRGEVYPQHQNGRQQTLRLPVMKHLRAPDGCRSYPLLLPSGVEIPTTEPFSALPALRSGWSPNPTTALSYALDTLPLLTPDQPTRRHKSKVNPENLNSVIAWYNDNYDLADSLRDCGVNVRAGVTHCTWHDDLSPSLAIWTLPNGKQVCRCLSTNSNCPLADKPYHDAFDLFCRAENCTPEEGVRRLAEQHQLGSQVHEWRVTDHPLQVLEGEALHLQQEEHRRALEGARETLRREIEAAVDRRGSVTIVRATPGLGKTHATAEVVRALHRAWRRVAIVAPTKQHAKDVWAKHLPEAVIWQSRADICTCTPKLHVQHLPEKGYVLPPCRPQCPYHKQAAMCEGRIVIYQHNHLYLNEGRLLGDADVVIVDESPCAALLAEEHASHAELAELAQQLQVKDDPAAALVTAVVSIVAPLTGEHDVLSGEEFTRRLRGKVGDTYDALLAACAKRPASQPQMIHNREVDVTQLPRQFLSTLLPALLHDAQHANTLVSYREGKLVWYTRPALLPLAYASSNPPAVVVLDASADWLVYKPLVAPWPVQLVRIDVPVAPVVRVIQCPKIPSTRAIVRKPEQLRRAIEKVRKVCEREGVAVGGGITYKQAVAAMQKALGGTWLHYGAQRGRNDLEDVDCLVLVASPTVNRFAMEAEAKALYFRSETPIDDTWARRTTGWYVAEDARLEAVTRLNGLEELRQAFHRGRLILREKPMTLIVISPWPLDQVGLTVHRTYHDQPHGNSREANGARAS